jgi:peptidoglycan/xylan/chitin deacetylase (PgdA/CDA1 family)
LSSLVDSVILTYHSIDSSGSVLSTCPDLFAEQMDRLAHGPYRMAPLDQIGATPGALAITFDDGYRNFRTAALPILERLRIPATIFIVAGECGGTNRWDSDGVPNLPLMDWDELKEIDSRGVTIGAHTMTHANLAKIPPQEAEREIAMSRHELQDRLQRQVEQFAYPYGVSNREVRSMVARHYRIACGTELSFASPPLDPLLLPRIDAYYLRSRRVFGRFAMGRAQFYLGSRRVFREIRSWASR